MYLMWKILIGTLFFIICCSSAIAEIVINEIAASNHSCYYDENMEPPDWFELYNNGDSPVNLKGYRVSDNNNFEEAWEIPDRRVEPGERLMVYASGLDRRGTDNYIMESSGWGFSFKHKIDGFGFSYIKISGDFEIHVRFDALRLTLPESKAGLMVREKLTDDSKYAALVCENQVTKAYRFIYRSDEGKLPIRSRLWNFLAEYPSYLMRFKREGDSLFCYISTDGVHWTCDARAKLQMEQDTVYLGVALTSGAYNHISKLTVTNLKINGKEFLPENFHSIEFNTGKKGRSYYSNELHTDFKLNREKESLFLWNAKGELLDKVVFSEQYTDVSYGRFPDGSGDFSYCTKPSPEKENDKGIAGKTPDPVFSNEGGWFEGKATISISSPDQDADIYYTKDGSEPDINSSKYTGETIVLDTTTCIRAKAFNDKLLNSRIVSNTYFIEEEFPLPTVSIAVEPKDLWDEEIGIFHDSNISADIEIPVNFELWGVDKSLKYETRAGAKLHGQGSTSFPQKCMRLYARNIYGDKYFSYPFFGDKGLEKYNHIVLRNGGNEWKESLIRDAICAILADDFSNLDALAVTPVIMFINGEYWGIEKIRERVHEDYLHLKHDIPTKSIDLYEDSNVLLHGDGKELYSLLDSIKIIDFEADEAYDFIERNVDINNIMEYVIMELYTGNFDWPHKNLKFWRSDSLDGKWRWILNDLDWTFGYLGNAEYDCFKRLSHKECPFSDILLNFFKNPKFKNKFINKTAEFINTVLQPTNVLPIVDSLVDIIKPNLQRHRRKWDTSAINWEGEIFAIKYYINHRLEHFPKHYVDFFELSGIANLKINTEPSNGQIKINDITISEFPWNGIYFQDVPVQIEAEPTDNLIFHKWVCDRSIFEDTLDAFEPKITVSLPNSVNLKAKFKKAELQNDGKIVINEIMYKSPPGENDSKDWIELYNADDYDINISGWKIKDDDDSHIFIFDQETNIKSDEYMVICRDINNFESVHPNVEHYPKDFTYGFGTDDAVRLYDSNDELVDKVEYLPSSPWPGNCVETGLTMELKNPGLDNSLPESWQASYVMNGTPGRKNSVYVGILDYRTISGLSLEIYPNPATDRINISIENPNSGHVVIELHDVLGNKIYSTGKHFYKKGITDISMNISKITANNSGTYFLSVNKAHEKVVKKIIVLP